MNLWLYFIGGFVVGLFVVVAVLALIGYIGSLSEDREEGGEG